MQKTIIITESQLQMIEKMVKEGDILLDNGDMTEYGDSSKVGTGNVVMTKPDGSKKPGKDVYADELGKTSSYQGYFGNARARFN